MARRLCIMLKVLPMLALTSCAWDSQAPEELRLQRRVRQAEIQQDIQRFAGYLTAIMTGTTMDPLLASDDPAVRLAASRNLMQYVYNAIDIATGPQPEVNLLDMVVFVALSRAVVEEYWVPEVYGSNGGAVLTAFRDLEKVVWRLAAKVLSDDEQRQLGKMITDWRREHPGVVRVEGVRFFRFSEMSGEAETAAAKEVGGIIASIRAVTATGDQAILVGNRAIFLAQRMPFLVRAQIHVATQEMLSELASAMSGAGVLVSRAGGLRQLVLEAGGLVEKTTSLVADFSDLAVTIRRLFPSKSERSAFEVIKESLDSANDLADRMSALIGKLKDSSVETERVVSELRGDVQVLPRRLALWLILVGAAWAAFLWGGFYLVRRLLARHHDGQMMGTQR